MTIIQIVAILATLSALWSYVVGAALIYAIVKEEAQEEFDYEPRWGRIILWPLIILPDLNRILRR